MRKGNPRTTFVQFLEGCSGLYGGIRRRCSMFSQLTMNAPEIPHRQTP